MKKSIEEIINHMKYYCFSILGKSLYESTFCDIMRPFIHSLSLIQAAQGAEIMLKAIIARSNFRYIFKNPDIIFSEFDLKNLEELLTKSRTVGYFELPKILEKTTRYKIKEIDFYNKFGGLRNGLMHFLSPSKEYNIITLKYIFEVLDPIAWDFWNETFIEESVIWDEIIISEGYLLDTIEENKFQVHPNTRLLIERLTEYHL